MSLASFRSTVFDCIGVEQETQFILHADATTKFVSKYGFSETRWQRAEVFERLGLPSTDIRFKP